MHVLPILSTLRRHRTAAALIVLQIALTCAIVSNAIFLIHERLRRMDRPSGVAEPELVLVRVASIGKHPEAKAIADRDLRALRAIPGVRSVARVNMVPFGSSSWNSSMSTVPDDPQAPINGAMYLGSEEMLETFGVRLVAGRDFLPEEYVDFETFAAGEAALASAIVTRGVAERLYPGEDPLGKPLYVWGEAPHTIVGVVDHIARPNEWQRDADRRYAFFLPLRAPWDSAGTYVLRVDPSRRGEVLAAAGQILDQVAPNRILFERVTFTELRRRYFEQDRAMAWLLVGVSVGLLVITALGIVGLASFWVQQRTRQIGVRRALGATRGDILGYFHTENFILATLGILLGMVLAYGVNLWLMDEYGVPRLPAELLPIGAILLWVLGQVAVVGPALRASAIPPAIATRTV